MSRILYGSTLTNYKTEEYLVNLEVTCINNT